MSTLSAPPDFKKGIGSRVEVGGDLGVSSVASGSESLWLGESENLSLPSHPLTQFLSQLLWLIVSDQTAN